jgi:UDP-3-O-[3-hydroxymyristoyl] N-acetylglucosamine deacetylase
LETIPGLGNKKASEKGIGLTAARMIGYTLRTRRDDGQGMIVKKTIKNEISFSGIGIHSGKDVEISLKPSDSGEIVFRRKDQENTEYRLALKNIRAENCTMLVTDKGKIRTMEHLLAVLWVHGVDSLIVELNQEEIPILDGSALPFVQAVRKIGVRELPQKKRIIRIVKPFILQENDASVSVVPDPALRITYHIDYPHPLIKKQGISVIVNPDDFDRDIAPARTFGFADDVPSLRERGLAVGGSLKNAVVLDRTSVISGALRYPDEFVRHKVLDFIGDLSLAGFSLAGHFIAKKAGHRLHLKVVRFLRNNPEYSSLGQNL